MNKFTIPAVAVAALLAVPAIAADQPRDQQAQQAQQTQPGAQQQEMHREGVGQRQPQAGEHELVGMDVVGPGGDEIAEITNVLVDEDGQVKAVIIQHGTAVLGVGGQRVAVPYERLQLPEARPGMTADERQARIDMTDEQLGDLPEYEGPENGMMQRDEQRGQQPGAQPVQPGTGTQQPGTGTQQR